MRVPLQLITFVGRERQVAEVSELEVVELIAQGLSNREIAEGLVVTERSAEAHVTHVLQKLGLRSRAQVAVWAVERGLVRGQAG